MIYDFDGHRPDVAPSAVVFPTATVIGRVRLADEVSVWWGAILRGDVESIEIGSRTNLQDGVVGRVRRSVAGVGVRTPGSDR